VLHADRHTMIHFNNEIYAITVATQLFDYVSVVRSNQLLKRGGGKPRAPQYTSKTKFKYNCHTGIFRK